MSTPRNNRFIFTYDETNSNCVIDKAFLAQYQKIVDKHWVFLISGYHLLTENVLTDEFIRYHDQLLENIRKVCGHLHFELAFTNVEKARVMILQKLLKHCESVGLNEVELKMFAEQEKIETESEVDRLVKFTDLMKIKVMLFHTFGKYIALNNTQKHYNFEKGFKTAEQVVLRDRRTPESKEFKVDYKEEDKIKGMPSYSPTLLKPISSSVGLGDTISSSIVIGALE